MGDDPFFGLHLAEVGEIFHPGHHLAAAVLEDRGVLEDRQGGAVLLFQDALAPPDKPPPEELALIFSAQDHRIQAGMALEDGAGLADEFLPGVAGNLLHGQVDGQDHPLHVHHQQAVYHGVNDGLPEVLLAFFKQGLRSSLWPSQRFYAHMFPPTAPDGPGRGLTSDGAQKFKSAG